MQTSKIDLARRAKVRFGQGVVGAVEERGPLGSGGDAGVAEFRFTGPGPACLLQSLQKNSKYQPGFSTA